MSGVTHVAAGAIIGYWAKDPVIGFVGGFGSHALLDMIPHYELPDWKRELLGGILLTLVILLLAREHVTAVFFGIFGSALPDLEIILWLVGKLKKEKLIYPTHTPLLPQKESKSKLLGALQILIIVASLWIITRGSL